MANDIKNQERSNDLLYGLLGLLAVISIGYFYVGPQVSNWRNSRASAEAKARDVVAVQQQLTEIQQVSTTLDRQQAGLDRLALAVPNKPASDELLVTLEAIASQTGVDLEVVQPIDPGRSGQGNLATVNLSGSYSGIRLFIESLENNLRPIEIIEMSLTGAADTEGASLVKVVVTIKPAQARTSVDTATSAGGGS